MTRGNWQVTSNGHGTFTVYTDESEGDIAEVYREEDAGAIAAASEMLSALRLAQSVLMNENFAGTNSNPGGILDVVYSAISKAERGTK